MKDVVGTGLCMANRSDSRSDEQALRTLPAARKLLHHVHLHKLNQPRRQSTAEQTEANHERAVSKGVKAEDRSFERSFTVPVPVLVPVLFPVLVRVSVHCTAMLAFQHRGKPSRGEGGLGGIRRDAGGLCGSLHDGSSAPALHQLSGRGAAIGHAKRSEGRPASGLARPPPGSRSRRKRALGSLAQEPAHDVIILMLKDRDVWYEWHGTLAVIAVPGVPGTRRARAEMSGRTRHANV